MTCYVVATLNIHDREQYSQYEAGFMEIFQRFQGSLLSVDEQPTLLEGTWSWTRTVLIEFPTKDAAVDWYNCEAYQNLMQHRLAASSGNVVLLEGLTSSD